MTCTPISAIGPTATPTKKPAVTPPVKTISGPGLSATKKPSRMSAGSPLVAKPRSPAVSKPKSHVDRQTDQPAKLYIDRRDGPDRADRRQLEGYCHGDRRHIVLDEHDVLSEQQLHERRGMAEQRELEPRLVVLQRIALRRV